MAAGGAGHTDYIEIPIMEAARRCGLTLNSRTLEREEVEASCPFCGDHAGKHHLFLNTSRNVYWCALCGAKGNSVSLYARVNGINYKTAAEQLVEACKIYPFPSRPTPKTPPEQEIAPLSVRHDVYYDMLSHLELSEKHRNDLRERGLDDARIDRNMYRTLPRDEGARRFLAGMLADFHSLKGIPGFGIYKGWWTLAGEAGLLIPYCDKDGYIQGLQVRLDDESNPNRKYRSFASGHLDGGTANRAWIHVTGNIDSDVIYLTEGGLKGDVASFLDEDALFVCFAGINTLGLLEETLRGLKGRRYRVALDMDKLGNWRVRNAYRDIKKIIASVGGKEVMPMNWNMSFKGVDDFYLGRSLARKRGLDLEHFAENDITRYLEKLWRREYPEQDQGFIRSCEWEYLTLPVDEIKCSAPRNLRKAKRYLALLQSGAQFPPMVCVNKEVIDGQHRFWAYQQAGYRYVNIYQNKPWVLPAAA